MNSALAFGQGLAAGMPGKVVLMFLILCWVKKVYVCFQGEWVLLLTCLDLLCLGTGRDDTYLPSLRPVGH